MTTNAFFIYLKIQIKYQTEIDDLPGLSFEKDQGLAIQMSDEITYAYKTEIEQSENEGAKFYSFSMGIFKLSVNEKRYNVFLEAHKKGEVIHEAFYDNKIKEFLKENFENCINNINRFFELTRWRFNFAGGSNMAKEIQAFWSFNGEDWSNMNVFNIEAAHIVVRMYEKINQQQFVETISNMLLNDKMTEPVYQKMIREAKQLTFSNSLSAYMIAYSALEVATKAFIILRKPDTEWLLDNLSSPDLHKIYSSFIPEIEPNFVLEKVVLDSIKAIMSERNKLAHTGVFKQKRPKVDERIKLIQDIIHYIDFFSGNSWAIHHVNMKRLTENALKKISQSNCISALPLSNTIAITRFHVKGLS